MSELGGIKDCLAAVVAANGRHELDSGLRLNEPEVYRILGHMGLQCAPTTLLAAGADQEASRTWARAAASLAGPEGRVLVKMFGRRILHKTDIGGVRIVDVDSGDPVPGLLAAASELTAAAVEADVLADLEGIMAAGFIPHAANRPGQELLLSLRQDPAFGACVVVGIGGTLTEWYGGGLGTRSTVILPARGLKPDRVREVLLNHPLLKLVVAPSRLYAQAPLEPDYLVKVICAIARLGLDYGPDGEGCTVEELEINPAVVSGGRLVALDGVGLVSGRRWTEPDRPTSKISALLQPRSAVVLGVSAKGTNPGRIILQNLVRSPGIAPGRLYVVHPSEHEIGGVPCFADVGSLPEKCDLAVVAIPAQGALDAITELVKTDRSESIILIPGGFAEAGETGLAGAIEDTLAAGHAAEGGGPIMVGGNCLGIVSRDNYNTFFLPEYKLPFRPGRGGNLAVVSQSGAYLVTFASNYDGLIQPRASISFGNQMDLTVSDFLEHFLGEDGVQVIACYVEGFRPGDGSRFCQLARRARRAGKQVLIFKAGKTALGAQAAASHTASLAGDYEVARSCLAEAGVIVAEQLDEFEDLIMTFTLLGGRPAAGPRTGIISNAGFECSTVMDQLGDLELAEFDPQTQAVLDEVMPGFAHRTNPIDCTPMTGTKAFVAACRAILDSPAVDAAILSSVPVTPSLDNLPPDPHEEHRENLNLPGSQPSLMAGILTGSAKPAVVVVDSGEIYDPMCRMLLEAGVPVFRKIDRAARALAAFCRVEGAR